RGRRPHRSWSDGRGDPDRPRAERSRLHYSAARVLRRTTMESPLKSRAEPSRVALLGFGTVGQSVARILCSDEVPDVRLTDMFNRHVASKRVDWVPASVCWTELVADIIASDVN